MAAVVVMMVVMVMMMMMMMMMIMMMMMMVMMQRRRQQHDEAAKFQGAQNNKRVQNNRERVQNNRAKASCRRQAHEHVVTCHTPRLRHHNCTGSAVGVAVAALVVTKQQWRNRCYKTAVAQSLLQNNSGASA